MVAKKHHLPKNNADNFDFEGLSSFEELDSWKLAKKVTNYGQTTLQVLDSKSGQVQKKMKKERKVKKKQENQKKKNDKKEGRISEKFKEMNENKKRKRKGKKKRNKQKPNIPHEETPIDSSKVIETEEVSNKAWRAIFTPEVVICAIKKLGFKEPSEIQVRTIPSAIKGRKDIIGAAETGNGKTLAFAIPIVHGILKIKENLSKSKENKNVEDGEIIDEEDDNEEELDDEELDDEELDDEELDDEEIDDEEIDDEEIDDEEIDDEEIDDEEIDDEEIDDEKIDDEEIDDEEIDDEEIDDEEIDDEEIESDLCEEDETMEVDDRGGIGCVKVIDNATFDFLPEIKSSPYRKKLYALIVTPTRELAVQIKKHIDAILTFTDIKTAVVIGGLSEEKQDRVLNKGPEIVIGTPGRLWEMFTQGNQHLSQIPNVRFLAVDETDRMVEAGRFEELQNLLSIINSDKTCMKKRQTFVFSATLTFSFHIPKKNQFKNKKPNKSTSDNIVENLISVIGLKEKPKVVDITSKFGTAEKLSEAKLFCEPGEKDNFLYYFLKRFPGRTLVFCNSINCVNRLTNLLSILGCEVKSLHASKQQKQRLRNLEKFTSNKKSVLIATDVAARGIDIPGIDHIVHYELPKTVNTYIHRSGRTARANNEGISVMFVDSAEMKKYLELCSSLKRPKGFESMPVNEVILHEIKRRVKLGWEIEKSEFQQKNDKSDEKWLKTMAEEADIVLSDDNSDEDELAINNMQRKKQSESLRMKKMHLKSILAKPLITTTFHKKFPDIGQILSSSKHKSTAINALNESKVNKPNRNRNRKTLKSVSAKTKIAGSFKRKNKRKQK